MNREGQDSCIHGENLTRKKYRENDKYYVCQRQYIIWRWKNNRKNCIIFIKEADNEH